MISLAKWAKQEGISYRTAWRWLRSGRLPAPYVTTPTGRVMVQQPVIPASVQLVALYARVSSAGQKADLDRQVTRLAVFANQQGLPVNRTVTEIGSALNGRRPQLMKLLADPQIGVIVIEHRDRLARFGFEYVEAALKAQGRRLVIAETTELESDLVQDMLDVLTSFCARLYGRRSARNRAKRAMQALVSPPADRDESSAQQ
jgi:putative resolvase